MVPGHSCQNTGTLAVAPGMEQAPLRTYKSPPSPHRQKIPKAPPSPESTRGSEKEMKQNIQIKKETLLPRMAADFRKAAENKMFRRPECFMNL